ncbi:Beta-mannosidase [Pseudozyma hubeiensis]|nr:Beta-mannosidase [Pseudozyma hubeiensis]
MTNRLFVTTFWVVHALVAIATVVRGQQRQQQQRWQLPVDPDSERDFLDRHVASSKATVWSFSTHEQHRRAFPLHSDLNTTTETTFGNDDSAPVNDPASAPFDTNAAPSGLKWSLSNTNGSIQVDALFPSLAHLDLLRAGIIQDTAIGFNEGLNRWVAEEPIWFYTADLKPVIAQVEASHNLTEFPRDYWLYFEGLDTIAEIFVGGKPVGETHNQFKWHAFRVPLDRVERFSRNTNITLVFQNVNDYASQQAAQHDPGYPNQVESPTQPRTSDYEYPGRIFLRKQQADLGWDWGPALVPRGPERRAYLISLPISGPDSSSTDVARIQADEAATDEAVSAAQDKASVLVIAAAFDVYRKGQTNNLPPPDPDANWIVNVTLTLLSGANVKSPSLRLSIPELGLYTFDALLSSTVVSAGLNAPVHVAFEIPSAGKYGPELWWPRGYGDQKLYDVVVQSDDLLIRVQKRVGFRTAFFDLSTVSQEEVEQGVQPGSNFRLFVNGREIYVMGTNVIPFDTLSPRINPDYLRWVLESAASSHINMIRIWGGGSYPYQALLDLCDEMGMMVWMDAIFAASLYPYYQDFLTEVSSEMAQVMVDVVTHPSIVAVVGNNEGELYFLGAYGKRPQDPEWFNGYELLFNHVIRDRVKEFSRGLSYFPSSTTTGYLQLDPYIGRYANYTHGVELHGTGEHYGYDAQKAFDINTYPRSRFMVEFGMFSLPSIYTLDRVLAPLGINDEVYSINSSVLRAHLKHPPAGNLTYPFAADVGQRELLSAISTYFPVPSTSLAPRQELHQYTLSSQLYQAIFVSNQISVYRRQAGRRERNRGVVVWQLNDIWEGTSWSSIEYTGRWKIANYVYSEVQAPVAALAVYNVTSDTLEVDVAYTGAFESVEQQQLQLEEEMVSVSMEWFDFTGKRLQESEQIDVAYNVTSPGSKTVSTIRNPTRSKCTGGDGCYLRLTGRGSVSETNVYWTPLRNLTSTLRHLHGQHRLPNLQLTLPRVGGRTVQVRNMGNATAPFVVVEQGSESVGYFAECSSSDGGGACRPRNAFWLNPGESKVLTFVRPTITSEQDDNEGREKWFESLSVWSLFDNL